MSGINSGILTNASPLSQNEIKQIENSVLTNTGAVAYLDENSEVCFAVSSDVNGLKHLAWHNAYQLFNDNGTFTKKIYRRIGLKTFDLESTLTKDDINGAWAAPALAPGLYQTGAIALYEEQGASAVSNMRVTSWTQLVDSKAISTENGVLSVGYLPPDNLPELNEYGFYYGVPYYFSNGYCMTFYEDGSMSEYEDDEPKVPAGSCIYDTNSIYRPDWGDTLIVSPDGLVLTDSYGDKYRIGSLYKVNGDLVISGNADITTISDYAFDTQIGLTGVLVPEGVSVIRSGAFSGCSNLQEVILSDGVTNIEDYAFSQCRKLRSITLPSTVVYISDSAFNNAYPSNLTFKFKGTVEQWCNMQFERHPTINYLYINDELIGNLVIPGNIIELKDNTFDYCNSITEVNILEGVSKVGKSVFYNCHNLTRAEIPASITYLDGYAFLSCDNLEDIIYHGTLEQWCDIYFMDSNIAGSANNFYIDGQKITGTIELPNSLTEIKQFTLSEFNDITTVIIPDSVTSIRKSAFRGSGLTEILIPSSVTTIGEYAFYRCRNLTSVTCEEGIQLSDIGSDTFRQCSNLKNVVLRGNFSKLPSSIFSECTSLESVTLPGSITEFVGYTFDGCTKLTSINFGGTVAKWKSIKKGNKWNRNTGDYVVYCTDGTSDF